MKQGLVRLLYNFYKRFMGWTLHMIMCVLLCYPVSIHMSQLLSTGRPISSSTLHSTELVVKLLQQLVTESTNQVLATQPCTVYPHTPHPPRLQSLPT